MNMIPDAYITRDKQFYDSLPVIRRNKFIHVYRKQLNTVNNKFKYRVEIPYNTGKEIIDGLRFSDVIREIEFAESEFSDKWITSNNQFRIKYDVQVIKHYS